MRNQSKVIEQKKERKRKKNQRRQNKSQNQVEKYEQKQRKTILKISKYGIAEKFTKNVKTKTTDDEAKEKYRRGQTKDRTKHRI